MSDRPPDAKEAGLYVVSPSGSPHSHLETRDFIYSLDIDFDVDSQLMAISGLLSRNRRADESVKDEIKKMEEHMRHLKGMDAEWAVHDWVDRLVHSTYQDAAHSMSAVGMLAPLIETTFHQCFKSIGRRFYPMTHPVKTHDRWTAAHNLQWDCHFEIVNGKARLDIVRGICQLSDATGLTSRLPKDFIPVISAVFAYRNCVFHNGFEWPTEERDKFVKRISEQHWPTDWFSVATSDEKPWVISLSEKFIQQCFKTFEEALQAIGGLVRDEMQAKDGQQ